MPASASLPPFCDWPEDLASLVRGGVWMVEGGHEYDGTAVHAARRGGGDQGRAGDEGGGAEVDRHLVDLLAARSQPREARRRAGRGRDSRRRHHLLVGSRPHRAARARECRPAERGPGRPLARDDRGLREGDPRFRHRRAAVHHPERRHGGGGGAGAAPAGLFLRLGRHQFDARRGLSLGPGRRHGDRCRRHHHRRRPAQARLSARGQLGGQGGRRAHAVPHARSSVDRPGRRQPCACSIR